MLTQEIDKYISQMSKEQQDKLNRYLLDRCDNSNRKRKFNVVFDLLHQCDIACRGCGTNACKVEEQSIVDNFLKYEDVILILKKIKTFAEENELDVFINFGGGEPFLRDDIIDILKKGAELFGASSIGIDTNASLDSSYEKLCTAMNYVGYVGVSINGLHDYHNWWANNSKIDAFLKATETVKKLCEIPQYAKKIEVTTVVTKRNMDSIPELMKYLKTLNVRNYSLHRPIPVGRMKHYFETLIPSSIEYFKLLIDVVEHSTILDMNAHMHHSIEGIYGSLIAGIDTYYDDNFANTNYRSSIGIEPNGDVVVDPWCTVGFWNQLKFGNILENDVEIKDLFNAKGSLLSKLRKAISKTKRCNGCKQNCSGGSRVVAAASKLYGMNDDIDLDAILKAMEAVDPACPFADKE